jgi:hypothetical protein
MFIPPIRDGCNAVGSTIAGVKIPVIAVPTTGIANPYVNGVGPHAPDIRDTADFLNMLLARRGRVLFRKYVKTRYDTASATDNSTLRFACKTGPLAETIRIVTVGYPAASLAASDSYAYWVYDTGLTGTESPTTGASTFASGLYTAHAADNFTGPIVQEFAVEPSTMYRFTLHQINAYAVQSAVAYELPRSLLDTSQDSPVIDTSRIAQGRPITTATAAQLLASSASLVSHGMSLFSFSVDGVNAIPASTTNRNILDGTTTPTASTLGWPVDLEFLGQKQGTGASSSNISVTAWAYLTHAPAFGASEGTVTFKDQDDNDLGTLDGFGVTFPAWVSTGFSIASNVTRIEVYGQSASGIVDPEAGGEDVSLEIGAIGIFLGS